MKKILLLVLVSLFVAPLFVFAMTESQCFSAGGTSYDAGICSCTSPRVWSGDGCECPNVNQVWNGTSCVITNSGDAQTANNCSSILCAANCSSSSCSTVKKEATYSSSAGGCVCPSGYYSSLAPTQNSNSNSNSNNSSNSNSNSTSSGLVGSGTGIISNPIKATSFAELINMITKWILDIAMVLAPLVIVYGGFTYITAAGDPGKMETGKKIIIYAVIGFILALLATSLVDVFKTFVDGKK